MYKQSGNFLVQALLALTLMFAFIPLVVGRIAVRDTDAKMYATTTKIENAVTAARIYIRENATNIPYEVTVLSGKQFTDTLEPYGLPLGFVPKTAFDQDIRLIIEKTTSDVYGTLEISAGDMTELKRAELVRRIGFYAYAMGDNVYVGVALNDMYSDIVRRNETSLENSRFLSDLDMGGFSLSGANALVADTTELGTGQFDILNILGTESDRKSKNSITNMIANRSVFKTQTGESALSVTRGTLVANNLSSRSVSMFGITSNIEAQYAAAYDFSLTAGHTGFTGPLDWTIHGSVISDRVNLVVDTLEIQSFINAASGQDAFIDEEVGEVVFSSTSGISADFVSASNITLRDQTSGGLSGGKGGAVVLDIRPAGTSILPDANIESINNDDFEILSNPSGDDSSTTKCNSIINSLGYSYNKNSLAQQIICQYVFWHRLERRINEKQCLMVGGNGC